MRRLMMLSSTIRTLIGGTEPSRTEEMEGGGAGAALGFGAVVVVVVVVVGEGLSGSGCRGREVEVEVEVGLSGVLLRVRFGRPGRRVGGPPLPPPAGAPLGAVLEGGVGGVLPPWSGARPLDSCAEGEGGWEVCWAPGGASTPLEVAWCASDVIESVRGQILDRCIRAC